MIAHPRVIACMLGYEDEIHHDLEQYLGRPVYLRSEEHYHPNTYRMEHLTLEQALLAVSHVEEGEIVEGRVINPDPEVSLAPLVDVNGIFVMVPNLDAPVGSRVKVRITVAAHLDGHRGTAGGGTTRHPRRKSDHRRWRRRRCCRPRCCRAYLQRRARHHAAARAPAARAGGRGRAGAGGGHGNQPR